MTYPEKELKRLLLVAKEAILRSGKFLQGIGNAGRAVKINRRRDIKISADMKSENIITAFLRKESNFPILAEESGYSDKGCSDGSPTWIIDPLDGSMNFFRGIPVSCVSLGLWDKKKPLLGAIYDFNKYELFLGIASGGAWLNDRKIGVSSIDHKKEAVLLTGFPSRTDFSPKVVSSFVNDIRSYKKVRLLGSAALSLAYVASGRAEAYFEKNIMLWDVAGGIPIVMGAGGRCQIKKSSDKKTFILHASNKFL